MEPKTFGPHATHPARALQAWQILIGAASNRQTLTYHMLSRMMYGKDAAGVLAQILGHIAYWCRERELPDINSIIVGKARGTPGLGIPPVDELGGTDALREQVYAFDWYDVRPPTEAELKAAYDDSRD